MLSSDRWFEFDRDGRHYVVRRVPQQVISRGVDSPAAPLLVYVKRDDDREVNRPATNGAGIELTQDEVIAWAIEAFAAS